MAKSIQQIEDYYLSQGLKGEELRKALENDSEYKDLLKERKSQVRDKYGISEDEEKGYILPKEEDYKILSIVKTLKNKSLSDADKELVEFIESQLRIDWREPLLKKLEKLLQKYSSDTIKT